MAVTVGTFAYTLVLLRAVRAPGDTGTSVAVPNLSVADAVLLGVAAILAFISHNAHRMEVSEILRLVLDEALAAAPDDTDDRANRPTDLLEPPPETGISCGPGRTVKSSRSSPKKRPTPVSPGLPGVEGEATVPRRALTRV